MWKLLYQLASPKTFYTLTARWLPVLKFMAFIFLSLGLIWGLGFAPADYQQGEAYRIIYIHVPAAFLSLSLYAWMGFLAVLLLVWRIKLAGILLSKVAQVGAMMALLALLTGSLWGKPMWGTWWIWDARLTSELVLFLLYAGIVALHHAVADKEAADKLAAILTLVGLVDLPIIHYSVYWWNTLHQGATLSLFAKPKIASSMLYPLLFSLAGFACYALWLSLAKSRLALVWRERRQVWVAQLFKGEC